MIERGMLRTKLCEPCDERRDMLTIDEMLQAYDDGVITMDELFGLLLPMLALAQPETIQERLSAVGHEHPFEEWTGAVLSGAEVVSGGRLVRVSEEDRVAIERYRQHARAPRYKKLARDIEQWMREVYEGEPRFDPDDIGPFVLTDIEPVLGEVVLT